MERTTNHTNGDPVGGDARIDDDDHQHHHHVSLVHVSLRNVTYAPRTRAVAAPSQRKRSSISSLLLPKKGDRLVRTTILQNVSTDIAPYKLTAWMGPSGSGKTSLISVVAGLVKSKDDIIFEPSSNSNGIPNNNNNNNNTKSGIFINGERGRLPKGLVGVVWQDDLLLSNLTVEETVRFAARLKTPASVSDAAVSTIVRETLHELGLDSVRRSFVGGSGGTGRRGISGGERKRVAVAVELVSRPSLLLLDEPTSGLDSTTALDLVRTLRTLAKKGGHAVVMVVHQPRTEIFDACDTLTLLTRGGRIAYDGPAADVREWLEEDCGVPPLPPRTGIADWIMDTVQADDDGRRLADLRDKHHRHRPPLHNNNDDGLKTTHGLSTLTELHHAKKYHAPLLTQLRLLTRRALKQNRGDKLTRASLLYTLSFCVFTAMIWWRVPDDTDRVYERGSLLFFLIITQSNGVVVTSLTTFHAERALLSRERSSTMYGVLPYFVGKTLADMTFSVCWPLAYCTVAYFSSNLRPEVGSYFVFVLTLYLTISTSQSIAVLFSFLIPNLQISLRLVPTLNIFLMILGGFYLPFASMRPFVRALSRLSFATYSYTALLTNEYGGRDVPCGGDSNGDLGCPTAGDDVLRQYFGIEVGDVDGNVWFNLGVLAASQLVLRTVGYTVLRWSR